MPWTDSQQNSGAWDIQAIGPVAQTSPVLPAPPGTIAAAGQWQSAILPGDGFRVLAAGATSSQAGVLSVQRFLDTAGQVPQGAASTGALTAGAGAVVNVTDGLPFASFRVAVSNSGTSAATVTNFTILMNAA